MIRWTWLVRNFEYPFEWTRRQRSVVFEVERAQKTFSRDFVGARSILDLDNYVEREKERERKETVTEGKWKMANGYEDYYDASWHLFPPDYAEEEYR